MSTQSASLTPTREQQLEQTSERKALRRAASASFMGNFVEWFDYAAYGYLATVIALTGNLRGVCPVIYRPSIGRASLGALR